MRSNVSRPGDICHNLVPRFFLSASFTEIHQNSKNFKHTLSVAKHPSHETDVEPKATSNIASALLGFTC